MAAQKTTTDICELMYVESELRQKWLRFTKRYFSDEALDESLIDAMMKLEVTLCKAVIDVETLAVWERSCILETVREKLRVVAHFQNLTSEGLTGQCMNLNTVTSFVENYDLVTVSLYRS